MTTEVIQIIVREDGSRVVTRNIQEIGKSAKGTINDITSLKTALMGLGTVLAVEQVLKWADAWIDAIGQMKLVTKNTEELAVVSDKVFKLAQDARQPIGGLAKLYTDVARAGKDLGASQNQVLAMTETVAKGITIQHASAQQVTGALIQLGQLLRTGTVRAQEFNSMIQNTPYILGLVAKYVDGANGSIGKLRQMMLDHHLTSQMFFQALVKAQADARTDFAKTEITYSQIWNVLEDGMIRYVGELSLSIDVTKNLLAVSQFLSDHMQVFGGLLIIVAANIAIAFSPVVINAFRVALGALFTLIATNPFAMFATAAISFALFRDQINLGIGDLTTLGDLGRAIGEDLTAMWSGIKEVASVAFDVLLQSAKTAFEWIGDAIGKSSPVWTTQFNNFFTGLEPGWLGIVQLVARVMDSIAAIITGFINFAINAFNRLPQELENVWARVYNSIAENVTGIGNLFVELNNTLTSQAQNMLTPFTFSPKAIQAQGESFGQMFANSMNQGVVDQGQFLENYLKDKIKRAQEISKARAATPTSGVNLDLPLGTAVQPDTSKEDAKAAAKAQRELDKLKEQLRTLMDRLKPAEGAIYDMAKARDTLNKAEEKGLITGQQHVEYLKLLELHYKDIMDPLGKINREIEHQTQLLGLTVKQREVESQVYQHSQDLQNKGIILTQNEETALRAKLKAMQDLNTVVTEQDRLLAESVNKRTQFDTTLQAISNLKKNNKNFTQSDALTALEGQNPDLFSNTQASMDNKVAAYQRYYEQIQKMRDNNDISEQQASQMRLQTDLKIQNLQLNQYSSFFGSLAELQNSGNKKMAAVGKAAAVAQTMISTYQSATQAYAAMSGIPYVGPALGIAAAAAAVAAGLANVAKIEGIAGFATGGSFMVGGGGGQDSQTVAFRATPGEKVTVSTPQQMRKGETGDGAGNKQSPPVVKHTTVNFVDPGLFRQFLSTPEGSDAFINHISSNSGSVRAALGV